MANKTVAFNNQVYSGTAGLTLLLISPTDGSIGNGSGDTLTAGSNGLFSCIVSEAITGWWHVVVKNGATVILEGGQVYFQSDAVGTYYVDSFWNAGASTWDTPYAEHKLSGSFGKLADTLRKANYTVDGVVSNAITPTTLTFASDVVATTSAYAHAVLLFVSGPLAGENSPIISYTSTNGVFVLEEPLTAAPSNGDEFIVIAGSHVHAIADITAGLETTVYPLSATAPDRVKGTTVTTYVGDLSSITVTVYDANDVAIDLTTKGNLEVCIESRDNVDLQVIAHASITISGASNNKATFTPNAAAVAVVDKHRWSLRTATGKNVLAYGPWIVERAALNDA